MLCEGEMGDVGIANTRTVCWWSKTNWSINAKFAGGTLVEYLTIHQRSEWRKIDEPLLLLQKIAQDTMAGIQKITIRMDLYMPLAAIGLTLKRGIWRKATAAGFRNQILIWPLMTKEDYWNQAVARNIRTHIINVESQHKKKELARIALASLEENQIFQTSCQMVTGFNKWKQSSSSKRTLFILCCRACGQLLEMHQFLPKSELTPGLCANHLAVFGTNCLPQNDSSTTRHCECADGIWANAMLHGAGTCPPRLHVIQGKRRGMEQNMLTEHVPQMGVSSTKRLLRRH